MTELKANPQIAKAPDYHVPVIIIGAGPAGLAAAIKCAEHGLKCLLLDEQKSKGGQIYRAITETSAQHQKILGQDYIAGKRLVSESESELIQYVPNATVWQVTRDRTVSYKKKGKSFTVAADNIILATGAVERPFPIPGWTLPGVLSCGGAQILLKTAAIVPSGKVVLAGCGPLLYLLADQYIKAGVEVTAIVDTSSNADIMSSAGKLFKAYRAFEYLHKGYEMLRAIKKANIPFYKGCTNLGLTGTETVESITFTSQGKSQTIEADVVLLHQGVIPNNQISWSLRAEHKWDSSQLCWKPVVSEWGELDVDNIFVAGDGASIGGALVAAMQGALTALEVCQKAGRIQAVQRDAAAEKLKKDIDRNLAIRPFIDSAYQPKEENRIPTGETLVCRCEGVTANNIKTYVEYGCTGPNQAKAFGRSGMGPCQGRMCGNTVTELMSKELNKNEKEVGYYRLRPPIKPITLAELADNE